jgi:hypothetical protein
MSGKLSRIRRYLDRFAVDERKAVKNRRYFDRFAGEDRKVVKKPSLF